MARSEVPPPAIAGDRDAAVIVDIHCQVEAVAAELDSMCDLGLLVVGSVRVAETTLPLGLTQGSW